MGALERANPSPSFDAPIDADDLRRAKKKVAEFTITLCKHGKIDQGQMTSIHHLCEYCGEECNVLVKLDSQGDASIPNGTMEFRVITSICCGGAVREIPRDRMSDMPTSSLERDSWLSLFPQI